MTPQTAESSIEQYYSKAEVGKLKSDIYFVNKLLLEYSHEQMNT